MSRMIDFKYLCPGCKHVSGQSAPKPTFITPTVGWIKCPECKCDFHIQITFRPDKRMKDGKPQIMIVSMKVRMSQRYVDQIRAQRERDSKDLDKPLPKVGQVLNLGGARPQGVMM